MRSKKGENMGEIKSVKVDNWGVFFLQKLQNFFNKTDYCDLTLQFNDNSQLKVHRLVLNACTDYFNVLEQTCEMIDDVLIMPNELQADLVVPIVNFMYTGTLEFELKIYGKLLKTARDMNMTVLLKLLEAHRRTMETKPKNQKPSPKSAGYTPNKSSLSSNKSLLQKTSNRSVISNSESIYKTVQIKPFGSSNFKSGTALTKSQTKTVPVKGPTRFEYEGSETLGVFDPTFDNISYESKPLKVEYEEQSSQSETSPFEQLRQTGYNNNKRPAQSILESPPAKKPNIQDVKEYAEQQRMRKQIAEEYGEEPDFESILDDEFHNNDDDEEYSSFQENTRPTTSKQSVSQHTSPKKQPSSLRKSNDSSNQHKPTIVVKECSSTNVDHAKIISEVLRKYPHLIKNNKNIKLKIMPTTGGSGTQKVVIKHESEEQRLIAPAIKQEPISPRKVSQTVSTTVVKSEKLASPTTGKILQGVVQKSSVVSASPTSNQPRRIDSKTMKQLISLGAENTTGPWLCLRCGVNGRPISIPSYRGFRRHLVNTHKEKIDPRLCEHCGWRSINQKELAFHMYTQHDVRTSISFPKCEHCGTVVYDLQALDQHIDDVHPEVKEDNQQCIYCNKTFSTELMLYNHMKDQHKDRARDDGVIDFSEEDEAYEEYEQKIQGITETKSGSKIQILSNIDLPKCISLTQINKSGSNTEFDTENLVEILGGNSQIMQPTDLITSIPPTISNEPKFINADGNVMELTPAQRAEIMSQLEQGGDGVVMVLDETFGERETSKTEENVNEEVSPETTQQEPDQHMVMSSLTDEVDEHVEEQVMEEETVQESHEDKSTEHHDIGEDLEEQLNAWKPIQTKEKRKDNDSLKDKNELEETTDTLDEQLEKLTQMAHPMVELKKVEKASKDELDERLKILTNDWTDDDEEEGEEESSITDKIKNVNDVENKNEEDLESETKTSIEIKSKLDNKIDNENIEDILKDNMDNEKQLETGEIIDEEKDQVDNKPEDKSISEGLLQKDIDNTEDSLVQQDSDDSDDEEQVLREQPICATEEDTPPTDNNLLNPEVSSSEPATLQQNEEEKEETKTSIEENKKETPIEENDLNIKDEIQDLDKGSKSLNNSTENEINENKDIEIENKETSSCETTHLPVEEKDTRKLLSDSKESKIEPDKKPTTDIEKEEIKSIINEWDEENDDDNEDL